MSSYRSQRAADHEVRVPSRAQPLLIQQVQLVQVRIEAVDRGEVVAHVNRGEVEDPLELGHWASGEARAGQRERGTMEQEVVLVDEAIEIQRAGPFIVSITRKRTDGDEHTERTVQTRAGTSSATVRPPRAA